MTTLLEDATASAELTVEVPDLGTTLEQSPSDTFPAVFATSRMIALMEVAAARLMRQCLSEGELSVGVSVDVVHSAATPLGSRVIAQARYLGSEARLFKFEVTAWDEGGLIGRGTHQRAIVSAERLVRGALRRIGCSSTA
jgi:fluoroacetyl-CoA thioesterase